MIAIRRGQAKSGIVAVTVLVAVLMTETVFCTLTACAVGRQGRKNWTLAKRDGIDHRVCARVNDDRTDHWARRVKARAIRRHGPFGFEPFVVQAY